MYDDLKIEIIDSKIGIPTLKVNNFLIHSKYDPKKEAEQFASRNYEKGKLHIIFGNGLGYYTEAFLKLSEVKNDLIIFDPIEGLNSDNEVFHKFDYQSLNEVFDNKVTNQREFKIICIPNYDKFFTEEYKKLITFTKDKLTVIKILENTVNNFSQVWQENYLRNIKKIESDFEIRDLEGKYNFPVIVASSGPSLAKQISLLEKYSGKYILVAAGSSVVSLMKYGLEPDYIVTMDGGIANYRHFKDLSFKKARLVYSLVTHYKIREEFNNHAYHYLSTDCYEMDSHYQQITNKQPIKLLGGGSVATYALAFARFISTGPITLVGQDLAYTNNTTHDNNNRHAKQLSPEFIAKREIFTTLGYENKEVLTDHGFFAMKGVFENIYSKLELNEIIFNSTEAGLVLEGYKNLSLSTFLENYANNDVVLDDEVNHLENSVSSKNVIDSLFKEIEMYDTAIQLLEENLNALESTLKTRTFKPKVLKILDKNENEINLISQKISIGIEIKKVILDVMTNYQSENNETEYKKFQRIYKQNKAMNEQLLEMFIRTKKIIEEITITENLEAEHE